MAVTYVETGTLPPNFNEFSREIGKEAEQVYGPSLARLVVESVETSYLQSLSRPDMRCFLAMENADAVGLLLLQRNSGAAHVHALHVLEGRAAGASAEALLFFAVKRLDFPSPPIVTAELPRVLPETADVPNGWKREVYPRFFMAGIPTNLGRVEVPISAFPRSRSSLSEFAELLVESFRDTPENRFQLNLSDVGVAEDFLDHLLAGHYGPPVETSCLCTVDKQGPLGMVLTVEALPGAALVSHLAVAPRAQRQGNGRSLLAAAFSNLSKTHIGRAVLAVDAENPARDMYRSIGFREVSNAWGYRWEPGSV